MISFQPTDEELAFVEVAKDIAVNRIRPLARNCEANRKVSEDLIKEVSELGILTMELPEEWDGLGLPLITQSQILQALSYGDLGVVQGFPGTNATASLLKLKNNHPRLLGLNERFLSGMKETGALLDLHSAKPFGQEVKIERTQEGYIIEGVTQPTRLAEFATYVIIFAKDSEGRSLIFLLDQPEHWQVIGGKSNVGLLSSGISRFSFEKTTISNENVLAEDFEAETLIKQVKVRQSILEAAKEVGLMEAALNYATTYTSSRKAFGQEIAKFQGVSFRIAKMVMETRIAKHLVWQAASIADKDLPSAYGVSLRALHRAHQSLLYITDSAVQLLGGHGFIQEFPVEKWMRDAKTQVSLYGSKRELLLEFGTLLISEDGEEVKTP